MAVAAAAAVCIREVYATEFSVRRKKDRSPVTDADLAAHEAIVKGLAEVGPDWPVISEESPVPPYRERAQWPCYWLVDPLDGTQGFVSRNGDFAVSIALIADHRPVLGVLYAPLTEVCYFACTGGGAFKCRGRQSPRPIRVRERPPRPWTVATSRSRRNPMVAAFIANLGEVQMQRMGSALKACLVAEGKADVYPGFSETSEWDTAAAQCIVEEAGGGVTDLALRPLRYNMGPSTNNPRFLVFGDGELDWLSYLPQRWPEG